MKKLLLPIFIVSLIFNVYSDLTTGEDVLAFTRSNLPAQPIKLIGSMEMTIERRSKENLPIEIELNLKADQPSAIYRIGKPDSNSFQSMSVIWRKDRPNYIFSDPSNQPTSSIPGTDITWAELSYSFLWWPNAELIREEKKKSQKCYVVRVPVPNVSSNMLLWIDKKKGILIEARTMSRHRKELGRLKILSTRKRNDVWLTTNLEFHNRTMGSRTRLIISNVEWPNHEPSEISEPVHSNNQLAIDFYKALVSGNISNLILSPYSIFSATAMAYCGARGETAEQMRNVLHLGGPKDTHPAFAYLNTTLQTRIKEADVKLNIANGLWFQEDHAFNIEYLDLIKTFYQGKVHPANFKVDIEMTRRQINRWVEEQTNDKIQNLIGSGVLSPATRLALINAVYFKADWANKFKAHATKPKPFYLADGTTNTVQMMAQKEQFGYGENKSYKVLELPYTKESFSMFILLPKGANTLNALETDHSIHTLANLKLRKYEVRVRLPKFKIESSFELDRTLSKLGMPLAFDPQRADFSGISKEGPLSIDSAIHKALITVGEEGTEAMAATHITLFGASIQNVEPKEFFAHRPFLFLIRENSTGTILFIGRVMDPSQ